MSRDRMQCTRCARAVVIKVVMDAERVVQIQPMTQCAKHWKDQRTLLRRRRRGGSG